MFKVSHFHTKSDIVIIRAALGVHFERFSGTLGDILVVGEGPGTIVEFHWISGPFQTTKMSPKVSKNLST